MIDLIITGFFIWLGLFFVALLAESVRSTFSSRAAYKAHKEFEARLDRMAAERKAREKAADDAAADAWNRNRWDFRTGMPVLPIPNTKQEAR
jgi:Tfp pilus assembly protein PilV